MGRRVRDPRRAAGVSAAGIATACDRRDKGYPVVTRRKQTRELLGKGPTVSRFGTEGSEVQILSPRPIFPNKSARSVWRTARFHLVCRVTGGSNPTLRDLT